MFEVVKYFDDHQVGVVGVFGTIEEAKTVKNRIGEQHKNSPYTSFEIRQTKKEPN